MKAEGLQWVGLVGWPVEHSVSPAMHNAAFARLSLNWCYKLVPTALEHLPGIIDLLREGRFRGVNVTVPHKRAVLPYLDEVTSGARAMGAVNTITVQDGRLIGHNTDAPGFLAALREAGVELPGCRALVLGAGGAARAACYSLLGAGIRSLIVLNRTQERAEGLVAGLDELSLGSAGAGAGPLTPQTLIASAREADLLVNTTPVGMWPRVGDSVWPDAVPLPPHLAVLDLVYNPLETVLLRQARAADATGIDGLGMLIHQGALAFELWTGQMPPVDVMRAAAERALECGDGKPSSEE